MATATKYVRPQAMQEAAWGGYTHRWDFSWEDFFGVTVGANTDMTFTVGTVEAGDQVVQAHLHLTTAFSDASDTAFNSITLDFGDANSATRYFNGVQIDVNGSEVIDSYLDPTGDYIYTGADTLKVNFNSMSGKDLTNVDTGSGYIEFTLLKHSHPRKNPGPPL